MISVGGFHACGVTTTGMAYCWGDNSEGELGIGSPDAHPHPTPASVSGGMKWATVSAGLGSMTCGVTTNGITYCWGANINGALGDGAGFEDHPIPTRVFGQP
jgi:alpha-tubulin suppressor-like RCC1 family protein